MEVAFHSETAEDQSPDITHLKKHKQQLMHQKR